MRTREEIMEDFADFHTHSVDPSIRLVLEVLLDIREMLGFKKGVKS